MITKATDKKFMHICRSCGNKREVSYNEADVRITSRSSTVAYAAVKCDQCGSIESFSSNSDDKDVLKVACRLLLNEGQ